MTDLRELTRDAEVTHNGRPADEAYLEAIRRTFGGCQAIEVGSEGPIKAFPGGVQRDSATGIGVYAPLRQRQGHIRIHDHMLNSSSDSPFSLELDNRMERPGNCRTPHTPVRVNYSESVV